MTRDQLQAEAGELFRLVVALDAENRALRALIGRLLFAAVERRDLLEYARRLVDERFPEERAA